MADPGFPRPRGWVPRGGGNLLFGQFFSRKLMKMTKTGPGAHITPYPPLLIMLFNSKYLPPVVDDDGSTANTATLWPPSVKYFPKDSINVLLPAPGGPESPSQE